MKKFYFLKTLLFSSLLFLIHNSSIAGGSCAPAKSISCGDDNWYAAPSSNHFTKSDYDLHGCYDLHVNYIGKDELFILDAGSDARDVTITLYGLSHDLDLFVFNTCSDGSYPPLKGCEGYSFRAHKQSEKVTIKDAKGTYYILVETFDPAKTSDFKLKVECTDPAPPPPPPPPASVCSDFYELHCNSHVYGKTSSYDHKATDILDYHKDCHGINRSYSGYERIYRLSGGHYGLRNVTIDLHSKDYSNHDLFIYRKCEMVQGHYGDWYTRLSGYTDYCHSPYYNNSAQESAFIDYLAPYDEIYIVVEGAPSYHYGYHSGRFELKVSCGGPCEQYIGKIECNSRISSTTKDAWNKASYYSCDYHHDSGHNWGPEKTYRLDIEDRSTVRIELDVDYHADLNLYLLEECDERKCIASSKKRGRGKDEKIEKVLYPGTYYVVVEGYQGDAGDFVLDVSGCDCSGAKRLYCDWPQDGTTYGSTNQFPRIEGYCFPNSYGLETRGRDRLYYFRAPDSRRYTFLLSNLWADLDLFAIKSCSDHESCVEHSAKPGRTDEWITLDLERYEEVYLVVDSRWSSVTSSYEIEVICEEEEDECFIYELDDDNTVTFDLSEVLNSSCGSSKQELTAYPTDPGGNPDLTSPVEIEIENESASFDPGDVGVGMEYYFCFERDCSWDQYSCCVTIFFPGTLSCGQSYVSTTVGRNSDFSKTDFQSCYYSGSSFNGPDEMVPFTKSSDGDVLTFVMNQETANLSLFILDDELNPVGDNCKGSNFQSDKRIGNSGAVGEYWTDAENPLPAGSYFAVIEGYSSYVDSDYDLTLTCGLDCSAAEILACDTELKDVDAGTGSLSESAYLSEGELLVGYSGHEQVYEIALDTLTEIEIILDNIKGSGADVDIFLLTSDCDPESVIAASTSSGKSDEEIVAELDSGKYFLVVDGFRGSATSYDLRIKGCESEDLSSNDLVLATSRNRSSAFQEGELKIEKIFPNPFADEVFLRLYSDRSMPATLNIMSTDGRLIHSRTLQLRKGSATYRLDNGEIGWTSGLHLVQVQSEAGIHHGKVMRITTP